MQPKKDVVSLYFFIYQKIKTKHRTSDFINTEELFKIVCRPPCYVPHNLRWYFLKEMREMGLIEKRSRKIYRIVNINENKITQRYKEMLLVS